MSSINDVEDLLAMVEGRLFSDLDNEQVAVVWLGKEAQVHLGVVDGTWVDLPRMLRHQAYNLDTEIMLGVAYGMPGVLIADEEMANAEVRLFMPLGGLGPSVLLCYAAEGIVRHENPSVGAEQECVLAYADSLQAFVVGPRQRPDLYEGKHDEP